MVPSGQLFLDSGLVMSIYQIILVGKVLLRPINIQKSV